MNRPRQVQGWRLQSLDWRHSGFSGYYVLHTYYLGMHPYGQGRSKPNILHASNVDIPRAMQPRLGMRLFGRDKVEVGAEIVDHVHVYVNYPVLRTVDVNHWAATLTT